MGGHDWVARPWGGYEVIGTGPGYQIKLITVNPGQRLSLQRHRQRTEHWLVVHGLASTVIGEQVRELTAGGTAEVSVGTVHRISNPGENPLTIVEVQFGDSFDEDDIERFEDDYGRA